jgi:hypothetical protein
MTSERAGLSARPTSAASDDTVIDLDGDVGAISLPLDGVSVLRRPEWYLWLKAHRRTWTAILGLREVLLIAVVYSLYDLTRFLVAGETDDAMLHGHRILHLEQVVGLDPEHALNRLISAHLSLGLTADYMYATLHYVVTPAVLVWLWRRHHTSYSTARTVLMAATLIALIGYSLLPVAPPRLLPGFVDTMAKFAGYGWWGNAASAPRGLGGDTNQFAAMPSLHVGWALWCGWQLARYGRCRVTRISGALYPLLVTVVVMGTANHYFFDAVAGVVTVLLAAGLVRALGIVVPPGGDSRRLPAGADPATT